MWKRCQEVVDDCALCNLLKARMNQAHKHFRAKLYCEPRTSYGADYYSVKQNKHGYNNVLGIIDLATGNLVLRAVKGRSAHNTAHCLFYDVVVHKGIPLRFHSDAAKEFLSTAMSTLQTMLGIAKSDTLAHNPKSNAKIERVWEFVGRCLRAMSPQQYAVFHLFMPIIAHVWNCTPDSDTNVTPFEAEHGMRCRSVAESVIQNPPAEGLPASATDLTTIAVAAAAFNEHLSNIKAVERTRAAGKLLKCGTRTYRRNIMHLSPYSSTRLVPGELQLHVDTDVSVGSYVAVVDNTGDKRYHIAKVLDVGEHSTVLHYCATKSHRLRDAIWKPIYTLPHSNVAVLDQPDTINRNHVHYTGTINTLPIGESLIILPNVGMTPRMRVNSRSHSILRTKAGYSHHRYSITWTI